MRLRLASLLMMVAAAGCHSNGTGDPCNIMNAGACVTAHVEGNASGLNQLRFILLMPSPASALVPDSPTPFSLPVKVGVVVPVAIGNSFDMQLEGIDAGGSVIAFDQEHIDLVNERAKVTYTLDTGTAPDLASPKPNVDMAEKPDLNEPVVLTSDAPDGGAIGYELEQIAFKVTATDPLNQQHTLSFGQAPDGGVSSENPLDTLAFTWTPNWDQAGPYPMHADYVSKDDPARTADLPTLVRVINSVDPALIINPGDTGAANKIPPVAPIGDFDGDGFADVAACAVDLIGSGPGTASYSVFVEFGDATGLPTSMPPMARIHKYSFNGTSTNASAPRLNCVGADIDGDGKSDVIISDPLASPDGTSKHGQLWILFGNSDRTAAPVSMPAFPEASLTTTNEQLGNKPVLVGDFNGDGKQDFATWTLLPNDNIYMFLGAARHAAPWSTATARSAFAASLCSGAQRSLIAVNDLDGDKHDELFVYDPNVGITGAGDCSHGGITVYKEGNFASPPPILIGRPAGSALQFASVGATACDVNDDGKADLVAPNPVAGTVGIFFAPLASPLPSPVPFTVMPPAGGSYTIAECVKSFFGSSAQSTLLADTGSSPVRVNLLSVGMMPVVQRQLPVPDPSDTHYGETFGTSADINGDGRNDFEVGNLNGTYWIVYGR